MGNYREQVPVECNRSIEKWQNVHISIAQQVALFVVRVSLAISISCGIVSTFVTVSCVLPQNCYCLWFYYSYPSTWNTTAGALLWNASPQGMVLPLCWNTPINIFYKEIDWFNIHSPTVQSSSHRFFCWKGCLKDVLHRYRSLSVYVYFTIHPICMP